MQGEIEGFFDHPFGKYNLYKQTILIFQTIQMDKCTKLCDKWTLSSKWLYL